MSAISPEGSFSLPIGAEKKPALKERGGIYAWDNRSRRSRAFPAFPALLIALIRIVVLIVVVVLVFLGGFFRNVFE